MRVRTRWILPILLLIVLSLAGASAPLSAGTSTTLSAGTSTTLSAGAERSRSDLSWHVLSSGGQDSASPAHRVRGTLGQLAIGPAAFPGGHALGSGYWYGIVREEPQPIEYEIYLPIVAKGAGR